MAEIRCPMCGKPNPAEQAVCQYCQARLKPLNLNEPSAAEEVKETQAPSAPPEPSDAEAADNEWPEWLRSFREEEVVKPSSEEESLPNWLGASEADRLSPASAVPFGAGGDDWLSSLRSDSIEAEPPASTGEPEWLKGVFEPAPDEEAPSFRSKKSPFENREESPTLPYAFRESEPSTRPPLSGDEPPDVPIPDWLAGLEDAEEEDLEDLPEWFKNVEPAEQVAEEQLPVTEVFISPPIAVLSETDSVDLDAPIPEWLASLQAKAGLPSAPETPETDAPTIQAEGPAEQAVESVAPEPIGSEVYQGPPVAPFVFDAIEDIEIEATELPDWLKTVSEPSTEAVDELPVEAGDEGLSPAALPAWLAAMRPVEAAAPTTPYIDENEQKVEASGPLAGLRGILRAEPDVARQHKSTVVPIKLQISDAHQAKVELLEGLIQSEDQKYAIPVAGRVSRQQLARLLVFLVLLVCVGWPIFSDSKQISLPAISAETLAVRNLVDALPNQPLVLLAVDYEPGLSGELDATSSGLIDHLMIKGAYLTLASTLPNGPLQAERLIGLLNANTGHNYKKGDQYINLGYIPGGAAGLTAFAQAPIQVLPFTLSEQSTPVQDIPRLAAVQSLADFQLLVVLADNADTVRNWIEQTGSYLGATPLVVVTSAQAEPLLRPYYDSPTQQVRGFIAGLPGSAGYESTLPRDGIARRYWDAFSYGLGAASMLILIIAIVNTSLWVMERQKRREA